MYKNNAERFIMTDRNVSRTGFLKNVLALLTACMAGIALLLTMLLPAAGLLLLIRETDRTGYVTLLAVCMLIIAGFTAGKIAASFSTMRGWLCGTLVSVILFLFLGLLSLLVSGGSLFSGWAAIVWGILFVTGIVGGIAGAVSR